jgi:hypothetical protein
MAPQLPVDAMVRNVASSALIVNAEAFYAWGVRANSARLDNSSTGARPWLEHGVAYGTK